MQRPLILSLLVACAILTAHIGTARAASLQVDPVNVTLTSATTNQMMAVKNLADEPVRVQISVFGWAQTVGGDVDLQPTHDLVFFPSLLTIAAHDSRNIRISAAASGAFSTSGVERSYRVVIEELLPPMTVSLPNVTMRVLTRLSVPIFVQPSAGRGVAQVAGLAVQQHDAVFTVMNAGTAHLMLNGASLSATAADGRKLFETKVKGWYILARGTRVYRVPLPAAACAPGATLTVDIDTTAGQASQRVRATCNN